MQAWILVFIIGVACGTLAAVIEKSSNLLDYWKSGYCTRDWTLELPFCCPFPDGVSNITGIYLLLLITSRIVFWKWN
jgi:H+/Cl- antiporter ClcA